MTSPVGSSPPPSPLKGQPAPDALARRAAELEVVAQVSLAVTTILDSAELLQTVVDLTQARFGLEVVTVALLTADNRALQIAASAGELGQQLMTDEGSIIAIDKKPSLAAEAARTRQSVVVNDVTIDPRYWAHPLLTATCSELVVPIIVAERLLGVLDVQSVVTTRFGPDEVRVFNILAAQLGVALENAWRFEEIRKFSTELQEDIAERKRLEQEIQAAWERRGRQVQVSTEVAQEIAAAPVLEELFWRVVDLVQARFGYYYVQVYTLEGGELRLQAGSGWVGRRLRQAGHKIAVTSSLSIIAQAAQTAVPVLVPDVSQEPKWLPNVWLPDTRSELAVPIQLGQEVMGVLDVQHNIEGGLTTEDQLLLGGLCGQIAIALDYRRVDARRQQAEDQLKKSLAELEINNRELEEFAFVASHDLQEPLRKIQAFSDRLQGLYGSEFDERGRDYLIRLRQAAAHTQMLIGDYLAFSRVSAMPQVCTITDLTAVIQTVLQDFEQTIQETGAQMDVVNLPVIEAELAQMHLLFRHLIGNALKFRQLDKPPQIDIFGELLPESNSYRITIADNGIGFDERYTDRIFRVFQRLHGREQYEGTGMGLAICRKVVERHHGRIQASSTPGAGAVFTIILPLHQPAGDGVIS